jgi:hypothetical protein
MREVIRIESLSRGGEKSKGGMHGVLKGQLRSRSGEESRGKSKAISYRKSIFKERYNLRPAAQISG